MVDGRGRLWVGQRSGLVLVDPAAWTVEAFYENDPDDSTSLPAGHVSHLFEDREGRLWVGTIDWSDFQASSLARLDETSGRFERHDRNPELTLIFRVTLLHRVTRPTGTGSPWNATTHRRSWI